MGPTNTTGYLLQHLAFVLARQSDQVLLEQLGIGFSQFKILMSLRWNPSLRQRQIADSLGQTEASISRQIQLMSEDGLISNEISPTSKREHIIRPTNKGMRIIEKALEILNRYHAPMFERLNERQQSALREALLVMHDYACPSDMHHTTIK